MTGPSLVERGGLIAAPFAFSVALLLAFVMALAPAAAYAQSAPAPATPEAGLPDAPDEPAPAGGPSSDGDPVRLSSARRHLWRWSFVERPTVARSEPRDDARAVVQLSTRTPERTDNLVLVLERQKVAGRHWLRVRLPVLPNNTTGWVRREALGRYTRVRTHLVVDTRRLRLRLERGGRTIFRARIGVGQPRWPTPKGQFHIRNQLRGFDSPIYGPVAFGTSARSAVLTDWPGGGFIGIHGTNKPGLLPGRVSHGCIRMRNREILRLARLLPVGTPLTIT